MKSPSSKFLPSINNKYKEKGGGGIIYPNAKTRLLNHLKSPKYESSSNEKLLHNGRVYNYFLASNSPKNKAGLYEKKLSPKSSAATLLPPVTNKLHNN